MAKAVFLDRDGVLNQDAGYVHRVSDLRVLPGVAAALKRLQDLGFLLIVVTNQSGVARGYYRFEDVVQFNAALKTAIVEKSGAVIDEFYICPHHPDGVVARYTGVCECRKPGTRLVYEAREKYRINFDTSLFVGDSDSDMECARRCGLKAVQVLPHDGRPHGYAFASVASLAEALPYLLCK